MDATDLFQHLPEDRITWHECGGIKISTLPKIGYGTKYFSGREIMQFQLGTNVGLSNCQAL